MARDIARTREILRRSRRPRDRSDAFVVLNPASAGGRTLRRWPAIRSALCAAGVAFDVHRTTGQGEATHAVRSALASGYRTIVVVGGDGTLNEVVNGFFDAAGASHRRRRDARAAAERHRRRLPQGGGHPGAA